MASHIKEFVTDVLTGRTSLKIYLAKNFPSLFTLKTEESEELKWGGVRFRAPRLRGYFTHELVPILGERWYTGGRCDVENGDIVIDAGAHFGFFSYYALKKGARAIYAFEPNPYVFDVLAEHVKLWEAENKIYPIQKALYKEKGKIRLFVEEDRKSGVATVLSDRAYTVLSKFKYVETVDVDATTIDDFVSENNIERVDFIKIDVEGSEKEVIEGARETIKKFKPKLAISAYHKIARGVNEVTGNEFTFFPDLYELPELVLKIRADYTRIAKSRFAGDHLEIVVLMW